MKQLSIQSLAGTIIATLGAGVMLGWLVGRPLVLFDVVMVFSTAFCFLLVGISLLLARSELEPRPWLGAMLGWIVLAVACMGMASAVFDTNLGLDLRALHSIVADGNLRPGRMAPNTAIAFMMAGLALIMMRRVVNSATGLAVKVSSFLVLLLGLTGLFGYALQIELIYPRFTAVRMAVPTAVGMVLTALGLWGAWHQTEWYRSQRFFKDDAKIAFVGTALLVVVGLTTGVAGFAAQQASLEAAVRQSLLVSLDDRATLFNAEVGNVVSKAKSTATRAALLKIAASLASGSADARDQDALLGIARNVIGSGATSIVFRGNDQREWLRLGRPSTRGRVATTLDYQEPTVLFWDGTLQLRVTAPIMGANGSLGSLTVEEPLHLVADRMMRGDGQEATGHNAMCIPAAERLLCYPDNRNPAIFSAQRASKSGKPTPMGLALQGTSGVVNTLDYRNHHVLAAYRPLSSRGLGLVVKKDTVELFAPIREQLLWGIPLLLALVAIGATVLRFQLKPLATRLVRAEARMRAVLEGVGEGIVTFDELGIIESFNAGASAMFGFSATEAAGLNIRVLIPTYVHGDYAREMAQSQENAPRPLLGRKHVERSGLRRDGNRFPLDLAESEITFEGRRSIVCIIRDITTRKRNEALLHAEKERLRVTLSSIGDGVITTDTTGVITYLNPVAEEMTGWICADAIGHPLPTVFHIVDDATGDMAQDPVADLLCKQPAHRLAEATTLVQRGGARFAIEGSAAPIRNADGELIGVVLAFHDVTVARLMASEMTHQASHDPLTGLINRREFERRLELAIQSGRLQSTLHTLLFMDLDEFKPINDTAGHAAGDALLRQLSDRLLAKLRKSDSLGRLGGDEFGVLLEGCAAGPALRIAEALRSEVSTFQLAWEQQAFSIGVSIGLVTFSAADSTVAGVLEMADAACYEAKHKGRNQVHVHMDHIAAP